MTEESVLCIIIPELGSMPGIQQGFQWFVGGENGWIGGWMIEICGKRDGGRHSQHNLQLRGRAASSLLICSLKSLPNLTAIYATQALIRLCIID